MVHPEGIPMTENRLEENKPIWQKARHVVRLLLFPKNRGESNG